MKEYTHHHRFKLGNKRHLPSNGKKHDKKQTETKKNDKHSVGS